MKKKIDVADQKPISTLLVGSDQREDEVGRFDSLMLFTLNSKIKPMKIVSIPCDSYTEVIDKREER